MQTPKQVINKANEKFDEILCVVLEIVSKKFKLTWLEPFVMPIGMITGMVVAVVAFNVLPESVALLEWRG